MSTEESRCQPPYTAHEEQESPESAQWPGEKAKPTKVRHDLDDTQTDAHNQARQADQDGATDRASSHQSLPKRVIAGQAHRGAASNPTPAGLARVTEATS